MGSLTSHSYFYDKGCETSHPAYSPYPRRLESLSINIFADVPTKAALSTQLFKTLSVGLAGVERKTSSMTANLRSGVPFVFVGSGKERLIQLLDYSSAAP